MNIALVFAGGVGSRMNTKNGIPKQFLEVYGKPIIVYTLEKFQYNKNIDVIVISCIESYIDYCWELVEKYHLTKVKSIVKGGKNGQESIFNGLVEAHKLTEEKTIVLIHDGVRPIIDDEVINSNIRNVLEYGSSITCSKAKETIAIVNENVISDVTDRDKTVIAKAPQCFYLDDIVNVHKKAKENGDDNNIDSSTLMGKYGYKNQHIFLGSNKNIKITTPEDYYLFKALLDAEENSKVFG